ncbi:RNA ligase partner protein [Thermosulfurimonas sp.]|uniref:RNA ligase partner protein n=1 Tax=Thermosulfurimonas sp. TaxID=2080236 RepID=UPI0025EAE9D0|nr:RNA ligase partner protein [Thermosulfurimonas sp.]
MEIVTPERERLIPDTSIFTNPDVYRQFGETPAAAFRKFLELAAEAEGLSVYMPSSIYEELKKMVKELRIPPRARAVFKVKSPRKYELQIPAFLLYEFIEDLRKRINKGLRVAEEAVRLSSGKNPGEVINTLRRKYREALREGILDSREDLELILLALELDGIILSADRGVLLMADKLGIRYVPPQEIRETLEGFRYLE